MQSFNNCCTSPNRKISGNWQISFSFKPDYISCPEEHKVSENTDVARGTDTSSNEGEKVGQAQPGKPVLAKQNHNPHSFWKSSKTVLIWEQFLLFDGVSFFTLSSTLDGKWGGRVSGAQERTREWHYHGSPAFWKSPGWHLPPNEDKGWCFYKILHF